MASNQTSPGGPGGPGGPDAPPAGGPPMWTPEQLALLPHDHGGARLVASIWCLAAFSAVFLALRLYCKATRHNRLWWDDYMLIAAWVAIVVECAMITHAVVVFDYGVHIWDIPMFNLIPMIPLILSSGVFGICSAIWSKTSFALTLIRLTDGWMKWVLWFIVISMNTAMGISAVLPFVTCTPVERSWNPTITEGYCWDYKIIIDYDIFSAVYSAAMDLTLALLPWSLVWKLQMKPAEKIGVAVAMSMGVFACVIALVKTSKIPAGLSTMDLYDGVDLFIWGIAESSVTVVAASIPILRVLIREVRTTARRYYVSKEGASSGFSQQSRTELAQHNTVVISSGSLSASRYQQQLDPSKLHDDRSDKSALSDGPYVKTDNVRIVRTNEVKVAYQSRKDTDNDDFELQPI